MQLAGGLARVQRPPHRGLGDAIHHGRARRLDRRDGCQPVGEVTLQRARHHHRQIGLHQKMVDGRRKNLVHRGDDRVFGFTGEHAPHGRGHGAATDRTHRVGLGEQVSHRFRLQSCRPARPLPHQRPRRTVGVDSRVGRQIGENLQQQPPVQGRGGGEQRIGQRRVRLALGVAPPDQARATRQVQPRRQQQMPFDGRRRLQKPVGRDRRSPVRSGRVRRFGVGKSRRQQSGAGGDLQQQPQTVFVDAGGLGEPFDVAHAQPAAAQFRNRRRAERLQHDLGFPQQIDGGSCGHRVDVGRRRRRHRGIGSGGRDRSRRFAP